MNGRNCRWRYGAVTALGLAVLFTLSGCSGPNRSGGSYPVKPVTLVVGAQAGASTDIAARLLVRFLEPKLGQPLVVVNKPGAGGAVGAAYTSLQRPDGYTLAVLPSVAFSFSPQYTEQNYAVSDFTYLATLGRPPEQVLVSMADKPWKNLNDMIRDARQSGRSIKLASTGPIVRLGAQILGREAGIRIDVIPEGGSIGALEKLVGGHADIAAATGWHEDYVKDGQMTLLASAEQQRSLENPDLPTLLELGYNIAITYSFVVVGPANLPPETTAAITLAIAGALADPALASLYHERARYSVEYRSPEETRRFIQDELEFYRSMLQKAQE